MNPVKVMQSSANTQESRKNLTVISVLLEGIFKKHGVSGEIMFPLARLLKILTHCCHFVISSK